jgi:hypothetical protein
VSFGFYDNKWRMAEPKRAVELLAYGAATICVVSRVWERSKPTDSRRTAPNLLVDWLHGGRPHYFV